MATTNASESKYKDDFKFRQNNKTSYQDKMNINYKTYGSNQRHSESGFKAGNNVRSNQAVEERKGSTWKNKDFAYNAFMEDEEEYETRGSKSHRSSDTKAKSAMNIEMEMEQLDKLEVMRRLEREKKALQKKLREEENMKRRPMPMKQKRSSKNDLTKSYLTGRLEEDDDIDFI